MGESLHVSLNTDAVKSSYIQDICLLHIFCYNEFISFKHSKSQVEDLVVHKIKSRVAFKYTVIDSNGKQVNILIDDAVYVPTMTTQLLSLHQVDQ